MPPRFEQHELGFSWLADPEEKLARASHALASSDALWLIDPVDADGLDEQLEELPPPRAVLQLLDRHNRDCAAVADRHDVPHLKVPFGGVDDSPFEPIKVVENSRWKEVALWWGERRALIVAESVGSCEYFRAGEERIGVHPVMRLKPPREQLGPYEPEHLLTGHGTGMHGPETAAALADALAGARRRLPRAALSLFRSG